MTQHSLIGRRVKALKPNMDCDENDEERPIPVGSLGVVHGINHVNRLGTPAYDVYWDNGALDGISPRRDRRRFGGVNGMKTTIDTLTGKHFRYNETGIYLGFWVPMRSTSKTFMALAPDRVIPKLFAQLNPGRTQPRSRKEKTA